MEKTYHFIAIFTIGDDGISIEFPDLSGCYPSAKNMEEAIKNAKEAMGLHLWSIEKNGGTIPTPSKITDIKLKKHQIPYLVEIFMPSVRSRIDKALVKRAISIPAWLNAEAEIKEVNFANILQEALIQHLEIDEETAQNPYYYSFD